MAGSRRVGGRGRGTRWLQTLRMRQSGNPNPDNSPIRWRGWEPSNVGERGERCRKRKWWGTGEQ